MSIYKTTGFHKIIVVVFPNQEFAILIDFAQQPLFCICGNQVELEDRSISLPAFSRYFAILQYFGVFFSHDYTPLPPNFKRCHFLQSIWHRSIFLLPFSGYFLIYYLLPQIILIYAWKKLFISFLFMSSRQQRINIYE